MVDRVMEIADTTTVTAFLIDKENVFVEDGYFREPGLIENMAQSAAAGFGARTGTGDKEPPVGFIGGIRNLKIHGFPLAGQEITTRVTVIHEIFDATVVQGHVFLENKLMAECELKIFLIKQ